MRVINVVDLMKLQPNTEHPHGLPDKYFDALFTTDGPIIFAFYGHPWLVHQLTYRRKGRATLDVRGYEEEVTTTVIDHVPGLALRAAYEKQAIRDKLIEHKEYICRHGEDMSEITLGLGQGGATPRAASTEADNV